jgi:hypothetical protein
VAAGTHKIASFIMVALDRETQKAVPVCPLIRPTSGDALARWHDSVSRKTQMKIHQSQALTKSPPSPTEAALIHRLFMEAQHVPRSDNKYRYSEETVQQSIFIMHSQVILLSLNNV